jgi:hypothetical protein
MTTRRTFLKGASASTLLTGLGSVPRTARASVSPADRKFLFVFAVGGWDCTRILSMSQDDPDVDTEPNAVHSQVGNIPFVDSPDRVSVRTFFERHYDRTLAVNGLLIPSIDHETCKAYAMTGSGKQSQPDFPTIIGGAQMNAFTVPNLVMSGPSFPGTLTSAVGRTGLDGQLNSLLSGDALLRGDLPVALPSLTAESIMDAHAENRAYERLLAGRPGLETTMLNAYYEGVKRGIELKGYAETVNFTDANQRAEQMAIAVQALSVGLSRTVTVAGNTDWDNHANDYLQSSHFSDLFEDLDYLMGLLDNTPGEHGGTLADETVVVVMSEMGRQPKLNAYIGRDHWPYTSCLLIANNGITTNRAVGAYDSTLSGMFVDMMTGELADPGDAITMNDVGATLLHLADIDPVPHLGTGAFEGILG